MSLLTETNLMQGGTYTIDAALDDATAAAVARAAGGGSVSRWVADLVRQSLMQRAAEAAGAYDRQRNDPDDEAARLAGAW